ncbi:MAG: hypothetical protein QMC25_00475 [Porticoccaceae bacterium]
MLIDSLCPSAFSTFLAYFKTIHSGESVRGNYEKNTPFIVSAGRRQYVQLPCIDTRHLHYISQSDAFAHDSTTVGSD